MLIKVLSFLAMLALAFIFAVLLFGGILFFIHAMEDAYSRRDDDEPRS